MEELILNRFFTLRLLHTFQIHNRFEKVLNNVAVNGVYELLSIIHVSCKFNMKNSNRAKIFMPLSNHPTIPMKLAYQKVYFENLVQKCIFQLLV